MVKKIKILLIITLFSSGNVFCAELPTVVKKFVPKPNFFLPIGTILRVTTAGAIFSFNVEVPVVAELDEPAICPKNDEIIFPKGTKLIGTAAVVKSDDRVNINFYLAVLPAPSGYQIPIKGMALSADGSGGLKGTVKDHKDSKYISSVVSGAMIGVGQVATSGVVGGPVVGNAVGNVMQTGAQDASQSPVKIDVSITVPPFQKCSIFLLDQVVLDPEPVKTATPTVNKSSNESEFNNIKFTPTPHK